MRSLEKIAINKGLVKQEPLTKMASVQNDLNPSENLTENILKLCSGLRQSGFDKQAEELERNFLTYKKANSLYGVHKEKGEDLIDQAHPKGGHKLLDVEGDALVETILERQLKMLDVINKKPTGKLANHSDILHAVKVVIAAETIESLESKVKENINLARQTHDQLVSIINKESTFNRIFPFDTKFDSSFSDTIDGIKKVIHRVSKDKELSKPGFLKGVSENAWMLIAPLYDKTINYLHIALSNKIKANALRVQESGASLSDIDTISVPLNKDLSNLSSLVKHNPLKFQEHWRVSELGVPEVTPLYKQFLKIKELKSLVSSWKLIPELSKYEQAVSWINAELAELENIKNRYVTVQWNNNALQLYPSMEAEVAKEEASILEFKKEWLKSSPIDKQKVPVPPKKLG